MARQWFARLTMNVIEEIKSRLDIVDVVGQYVQLQKAGRNLKGPCPFHSEKTPSFFVSPEHQSWHCFGACGAGGDVFSFLMKREGMDFGQTLRLLAERTGVRLPEREEARETDETKRLLAANEAAASYYHGLLLHATAANGARQYLEGRGVPIRWMQEFGLGWSPDTWEDLRDHLRRQGFADAELLKAGLLVQGESRLYDRFRGRLMFPIRDLKGRVIGFGARALDGSQPKYLNTSQTPIFDKGAELYAMDRARQAIRTEGKAVIVEGYMDVIAAHQHGFTNVIASMGTALTERQVRLVKRYAGEIVLALDADAAGSEAALRGQEVVEETLSTEARVVEPVVTWSGLVRYQEASSVRLFVAELPSGKDPDELIRSDQDAWRQTIGGAKSALDHKFDAIAARTSSTDPQSRSQAVRELLPVVGALNDAVIRAHYLQRLSRLALMREEELARMLSAQQSAGKRPARQNAPLAGGLSKRDAREEFLLALLLHYPGLVETAEDLQPELLWRSENRQILEALRTAQDLAQLYRSLTQELREHVDRLLHLRDRFPPEWDADDGRAAFADCLQRLQRRQRELQKQAETALLAAEESSLTDRLASLEAASQMFTHRGAAAAASEHIAAAAELYVRDTEAGLLLHGQTRQDIATKQREGSNKDTEVIPE